MKRCAVIVVAPFALYLVAMNVFLRTRLFRKAIADDLTIEYASAYSIVPGFVHVEGLTIKGRDSNVEWLLELDRCDFRVSFLDLAHRRFHATRARADGLALRARVRLEEADATPATLAALPPIPGFLDPPMRDAGPDPPPLTDESYNLWSVALDDVDVDHVRELWVHTTRYAGDMRVRGSWKFRPLRELEVGPATVDLHDVDVEQRPEALMLGVNGVADVTIRRFDLRQPVVAIVNVTTVRADLHAHVPPPRAWNAVLKWPVHVARSEGRVDGVVAMDDGVLVAPTHVRVEVGVLEVDVAGGSTSGAVNAELAVDDVRGVRTGTIDLRLADMAIAAPSAARAHVDEILASVSSTSLDVHELFKGARFDVALHRAVTADVGEWGRWLPALEGTRLTGGAAHADARVDGSFQTHIMNGDIDLATSQLAVAHRDLTVKGDVHAIAHIEDMHMDGSSADLAGSLSARDLVVTSRFGARDVTIGRIAFAGATTHDLLLRNDRPSGNVAFRLSDAITSSVPDLARAIGAPDGVITSGAADASGAFDIDVGARAVSGRATILARGLAARIGPTTVTGDASVSLVAAQRGNAIDLTGSRVVLGNVAADGEGGWWSRFELRDASLRLSGSARFHARIYGSARDARPAFAVVVRDAHLPDWCADLMKMNNLHAYAEVTASRADFVVHSLVARGDGGAVQLEYDAHRQDKIGAVLLQRGPLVAGVALTNGSTSVVLIGAESWFKRWATALASRER